MASKWKGSSGGKGKWLALGMLMLIGLTNYMDRLSISILQVPIKADLGLSDTQLGAITGLSFSLVYTFAALPIARLADRYSPKLVIIASLAVWNVMTMLCGAASGFLALAALRMGVAIGESGCGPATQSLLAGHFPPEQRGRAIAIWQMVFPLGTLLGIAASGLLSEALGWRLAFVVLGGAGLAVVPLTMLFLKEPVRRPREQVSAATPGNMRAALGELLASSSFRNLLAAGFFGAIPLNAVLNWNAPYYGRSFDLPMSSLALYLALIAGLGGALGMFGGGFLSDRLGQRDRRWYCWLPALMLFGAPFVMVAQYFLAPSAGMSLLFGALAAIMLNCWMPPQAAIVQSLVISNTRARAAACILVTAGIGSALGPFLTGMLSDLLANRTESGGEALRYALLAISTASFLAGGLFLRAARHLRADLDRAMMPRDHQPAQAAAN